MEQDTRTLTLVEFYRARLAEEERLAHAAVHAGLGVDACGEKVTSTDPDVQDHFATWNPVRVLAEVGAKRAIIELVEDQVDTPYGEPEAFLPLDWLAVLKQLALPYASHEDYREEWRP